MKNFKKLSTLFFVSVLALSTALVSCSDDDKDPEVTPLTFDVENVEIAVGATVVVKVKNGDAPYTALEKEKKVATAKVEESTITITGVSKGKATVVVTDSKQNTGTITVTVVKKDGIDFDKEELKLKVDEEGVVTILGGIAPYEAVVEKEDIATATIKEDKLTVKGLKAGTTLITVTGLDKMSQATISVTVE